MKNFNHTLCIFLGLPSANISFIILAYYYCSRYVRYLTDMHSDFTKSQEDSEIILKTRGDWWAISQIDKIYSILIYKNKINLLCFFKMGICFFFSFINGY